MRAAVLHQPAPIEQNPMRLEDLPMPLPDRREVLLRVEACGVCRTDLHITNGELPPLRPTVIPGHQIVGHVEKCGEDVHDVSVGERVGVSWLGGTDGTCPLCHKGMENLCDQPTFTGYTVNGGYAEYTVAARIFVFPYRNIRKQKIWPRYSVPGLSVSAAYGLQKSSPESASDCSDLALRRIWQLMC